MYQGTDFSECFYTVGLMQDVLIYLLFFFCTVGFNARCADILFFICIVGLMQDVLIYLLDAAPEAVQALCSEVVV